MNVIDAITALCILVFALRGWRRGASNELPTFAGWALGFAAAMRLTFRFTPTLAEGTGLDAASLGAVVFASVFAAGYGIFWWIGRKTGRSAMENGPSAIDAWSGLAVGLVQGVALAALLLFVGSNSRALPAVRQQVEESPVAKRLADGAEVFVELARDGTLADGRRLLAQIAEGFSRALGN